MIIMSSPQSRFHIRPVRRDEAALVLGLICELAEYEKLGHEVVATESDLHAALFCEKPVAECIIAELDNAVIGFALFFHNFSTFVGKPGLYLEDLYVKPEFRGQGYGKKMLAHLANLAVQRGCGRFEWAVLDWNAPAIHFYQSLGAQMMETWKINRLTGEALVRLATEAGD